MRFGWDISTSIVGIAIFDNSGKYVESRHIDLRKMDPEMIDKADVVDGLVRAMAKEQAAAKNYEHVHYVEDKLGGFTGGRTMQQTLLKLAAFNLTVSYIVWKSFHNEGLNSYVDRIHPSTVKSIMRKEGLIISKGGDKKKITLDFVCAKEKSFEQRLEFNRNGKPQPWHFDEADAYITARAGFLRGTKTDAA